MHCVANIGTSVNAMCIRYMHFANSEIGTFFIKKSEAGVNNVALNDIVYYVRHHIDKSNKAR